MAKPEVDGSRWRARPLVAGTLVVAVFAIPVVCSVGAAALVGHLWAPAGGLGSALGRWVAILGISTLVFFGCERLTRRALPLTVLLKMGMVFPGRAPRRLSVARRSWTTRDLSRRIDEARHQGITDEPTVAAEQIVALAATLSAHDRRTRGHAERVRAFTDLIAEELRLPEDDRDRLRWSALLHDVGKLTVHTDILNKPGALSDPEWEQMRRHPLEGAKLTAPLAGWLGPWANTIAEHHERFDGLGYPFGLAGQEISTGGRIVAVADCYDTMTSLRSYKKPMPTEAARAELAACSGAQFDPIIVRAFLAVSVSRLHALAPLTWIASLPFGNLGPQLARLAAVGGRVGATGVVATVGVVGLTAGQQAVGSAALTPLSGTHRAGAGAPAPAGTTTGATVGPGRGGTGVGPARSGSSTHVGTGTRTTVSDGGGPQPTGSGKVGDDAGGADQARRPRRRRQRRRHHDHGGIGHRLLDSHQHRRWLVPDHHDHHHVHHCSPAAAAGCGVGQEFVSTRHPRPRGDPHLDGQPHRCRHRLHDPEEHEQDRALQLGRHRGRADHRHLRRHHGQRAQHHLLVRARVGRRLVIVVTHLCGVRHHRGVVPLSPAPPGRERSSADYVERRARLPRLRCLQS